MCAEDQMRINLYQQGTVITELITKGHIYTSQHGVICLNEDFLHVLFGQSLLPL